MGAVLIMFSKLLVLTIYSDDTGYGYFNYD